MDQINEIKKGVDVQPVYKPYVNFIKSTVEKPIFITSHEISDDRIFSNGLYQNIFLFYRFFEIIGYKPYLLIGNVKKLGENYTILKQNRLIDFQSWFSNPFNIFAYIEMGYMCDDNTIGVFKSKGANIYKLNLGNSLTADIEKCIFHKMDAGYHYYNCKTQHTILVSPHHDIQQEFVSVINSSYPNVKIAPYIWEPILIHEHYDIFEWKNTGSFSFTIMEPNLSFLKCSFIPIIICEEYYRRNSNYVDGVVAINGNTLTKSKYFTETVLPNLDLYSKKKLHLLNRCDIKTVSKTFKHNIVILHAVNNDYNYMFFEFLYMGFPVIHNYSRLRNFGYYYKDNNILEAVNMIDKVIKTHGENLESYKATNRQLIWNFSMYNPDNMKSWENILTMD
jgi:hypothetical protein